MVVQEFKLQKQEMGLGRIFKGGVWTGKRCKFYLYEKFLISHFNVFSPYFMRKIQVFMAPYQKWLYFQYRHRTAILWALFECFKYFRWFQDMVHKYMYRILNKSRFKPKYIVRDYCSNFDFLFLNTLNCVKEHIERHKKTEKYYASQLNDSLFWLIWC